MKENDLYEIYRDSKKMNKMNEALYNLGTI